MFNNYKDPSGYYSRQPSYQDDINQPPLVPKEGSKQTSAPPWDLSQPYPTYNYCTDQHLPVRMPALMQRQVISYDNTQPLYRSYNNTNNQHVLRPKALITCQSNCNRVGCCSKDSPRVPHHWNLCTDKNNANVSRSTISKGASQDVSQPVSQHTSSLETGSRPTGNIDCAVKEFPRFHRDNAGTDHFGMNIPQFKNDLTTQQEGSISKQLSVTSSKNACNPKKDTSLHCQKSCAPNCQQYDHQASKFSLSGQPQLNAPAPSVSDQWLSDSQTRMWGLQNKQSQCLMPIEGVDMTVNNTVASNYWLERTREKSTVPVPTSKSSYQNMFEYQIHQDQHQKYAQHYQDPDRLKMMERVRYQESLRSAQQEPSDWPQDIPRRRNIPPYPVPIYPNVNTNRPTRPNHDPVAVNSSLPPTYPYAHSKVPLNYTGTDPTPYSSRFSSTYTQAQSKIISKSNNSFNHSTHTTNIVPANCIRPTITQHQPPHFPANVDSNAAQTVKNLQYVSSAQSYNDQSYTSCNEVYNNVNYSKNMQVVDQPCLNTPRIIQPYSVYDKNNDPFYKSVFVQNPSSVTRNLVYDKNMPPRQIIYDQAYNTENLQSTTNQQLDNYMAALHNTRPTHEHIGMLGSHTIPQNALFGQPPTAVSQVESETLSFADSSDRPIKKRKPQLTGFEKPLGMDLRQFIETWEEEPEDVSYQTVLDTDSNKVVFRNLEDSNGTLEETNADSRGIKLYPSDSDVIQAERNNTGTSVIKALIKDQQPSEQSILSSEKVSLQESPLKSNNEATNSPSGILQNLLSSAEDVASSVGDLHSDELNDRPRPEIVPGSDNMSPGLQISSGYDQSKLLTQGRNLEQTSRETKYSKSIVANGDKHKSPPNGKQRAQGQLSNICDTPLAENVITGLKQVNDINFMGELGENLNRKQSFPEANGPNTQSHSSISCNVARVNNNNLMSVEDCKQTLPVCSSGYVVPNSPKGVFQNVLLVDEMDIKKSNELKSEQDKSLSSQLSSSKDLGYPTSTKHNNASDAVPLPQSINVSCKTITQVKSNIPKEKNITQNLPNNSITTSVLSQVTKMAHRSSRPRPLSRKRKSFQDQSMEGEATVEDKNSKYVGLISLPIETAENKSLVKKIHDEGVEKHFKESLNIVACKTKEIVTAECTSTVNRYIDSLAKITDNCNRPNSISEDACTRLDMPCDVSEVSPLTKPVPVNSTSSMEDSSTIKSTDVRDDLECFKLKPLPKDQIDKNVQDVSVTNPGELIMENELASFSYKKSTHNQDVVKEPSSSGTSLPTFGLPEIDPTFADPCNEIQNENDVILCDKAVGLSVEADIKAKQFNIDGNLHNSSLEKSLESSRLDIKDRPTSRKLTEHVSHNLQKNVIEPLILTNSVVAPSHVPLDEETQPIIEVVKEKCTRKVLAEDTKIALLKPITLPLHLSLNEMSKSNKDTDITQFTNCGWLTSTINQKKTVVLGQSQKDNNVDDPSEIDDNKPLDSLSMSTSFNRSAGEKNIQFETIKTVKKIQSTGHRDHVECRIDTPQRSQSLEKCSNSVIRYISSEIPLESVTHKHTIDEPGVLHQHLVIRTNSSRNADEPCMQEQKKVYNKSRPIQLKQTDIIGSNNSVQMQENIITHECSRKSKLLSVRRVKKNSNRYNTCNSRIGSVTGTDEQSKECLDVQEKCSFVERGAEHSYPPVELDESVGLQLRDSRDESDLVCVEFSNSWDDGINEDKTKASEPCPGKQIGMRKESQPLNENLEQVADSDLSTVKLPQNQETLSQPSYDESNDDVLDLDASYDFDMQAEEESHSNNKESSLSSGSKSISIPTASHKSVNLKSAHEEDGNIVNVGTSYNGSNIVQDTNVRHNTKIIIPKLNAPSSHSTIHEGASTSPENNGTKYSKPHLEQNTANLIEIKNISLGLNNISTQSSTTSDNKIQHLVKSTLHTQDIPIPSDKSKKGDRTEVLKPFEKLQAKACGLLTPVAPLSTTKRNFIRPQQIFFKSRCDRIHKLKSPFRDKPEGQFTKSSQDTNLQPVLDKPNLITDASPTVDNLVPKTVNYVVKPYDMFRSYKEDVTLVNQNLKNFETLGNKRQSQTKRCVTSTEVNECLPVNNCQAYGIGNSGILDLGVQESDKRKYLMDDSSYKRTNIEDDPVTGNDEVALVKRDAGSTDYSDAKFKAKTYDGRHLGKQVEDGEEEGRDQTSQDADVDHGRPLDRVEHSTEDCSAIERSLDNGINLNKIVQDGRDDCKLKNTNTTLFRPVPLDKDDIPVGDNLSVPQSRDEHPMGNYFPNVCEGHCVTGSDFNVKINNYSNDYQTSHDSEVQLDKEKYPMEADVCEHSKDSLTKHDADVQLDAEECPMQANVNEHSKDAHTKSNADVQLDAEECPMQAVHEHSNNSHTKHDTDVPLDIKEAPIQAGLNELSKNRLTKHDSDVGLPLDIEECPMHSDVHEHSNNSHTIHSDVQFDKEDCPMNANVDKHSNNSHTKHADVQLEKECPMQAHVYDSKDSSTKHNTDVPLYNKECPMNAELDEHSKNIHTKHDKDVPLDNKECPMESDISLPLSFGDLEHSVDLDQITNGEDVDCQTGHGSSMEIDEVQHLIGDDSDGPVSKDEQYKGDHSYEITKDNYESSDASCITEDKNKCVVEDDVSVPANRSTRQLMDTACNTKGKYERRHICLGVEMGVKDRLMKDMVDPSVDKDEVHLLNYVEDSCESGHDPHITVDNNDHSVKNNVHLPVSQKVQNLIDTNLNKIVRADETESQTGKGLDIQVDTNMCSKKDGTYKLAGTDKLSNSQLDNGLGLTISDNDGVNSMNDKSDRFVEESKYIKGNAPVDVDLCCIFTIDKDSSSKDVAKLGDMGKTAMPLPIGIEHSAPDEQSQPTKDMVQSNLESTLVRKPGLEISHVGASLSSSLLESDSSFKKLQVKSCTNSEKSSDTCPEVETEQSISCEDRLAKPNTCNKTVLQTCFEGNQTEGKSTTEASFSPEHSDDVLSPITEGQNQCPLVLNSEPCRRSEEETIEIAVRNAEINADTLSNSSESPEMPLLEVISDLNSSSDQTAACETICDSDTEMPLLEKFNNSPTSCLEERRLNTTMSQLHEDNYDFPESSRNWNCVDESEEHCTNVSCIDLIPVESVSNWPYLEEEVFSEAQITGSPQVELPSSGLDGVSSDQPFTSSSDTETEPDSVNVPSTNTALDNVNYNNRDIDNRNEVLNVTPSSADLKCRLSWKKIFNLAKVEERKKHRVVEAKNRKEAYRRWPYYGKTGHKRLSLKSPNKLSNLIDKCDKEESSVVMSPNDVDGLVLGPAKIEFRLAPKSQTERWQVVDGSKAITLTGEKNNNVADRSVAKTLKSKSPIVLVKRIILKRRGDDNHIPKNASNLPRNYPCSTSMSDPSTTFVNRPNTSATSTIPSIRPVNEANCESEFSCMTTPPESDDSSASLKTLERLPKVIIKRTGYGNAKYKSFLRLSAAEGSCWQPFVRLERKRYLDNLAKQLFLKSDFAYEDIGNTTQQPVPSIALSVTKQPQEVSNRSSNEDTVIQTTPDDQRLLESVPARLVDVDQEHVSKKLYKGTYTAIKKHSKDTKLTFQLSNTNKQCTDVCDTEKDKQGIVNNKIIKRNELEMCQERVVKTMKHSARRCSEGGAWKEKKKPHSKYRARIGSEGTINSGALKPKKRSSNESDNYSSSHDDEIKSKFPKMNQDNVSVQSTAKQYNIPPEKVVTREHKWKKSLKQKLNVTTCQACNYSIKNEADQSAHIRQHPYHCQKCSKAFKSEEAFKSHLSAEHPLTKELHHCLLCKLSFPSDEQHQQHLSDRQHRHLDLTQRWTIQTLFKMFTGESCSRITPLTDSEVAEMSKLTDAEPGAINYYHQATPLQLAVQDLLKQSRKLPNAGVLVPSPSTTQDANDSK